MRRHPASWWQQYWVLQKRSIRRTWRNRRSLILSMGSVYFYSLLAGILFLNAYYREAVFYQLSAHVLVGVQHTPFPKP